MVADDLSGLLIEIGYDLHRLLHGIDGMLVAALPAVPEFVVPAEDAEIVAEGPEHDISSVGLHMHFPEKRADRHTDHRNLHRMRRHRGRMMMDLCSRRLKLRRCQHVSAVYADLRFSALLHLIFRLSGSYRNLPLRVRRTDSAGGLNPASVPPGLVSLIIAHSEQTVPEVFVKHARGNWFDQIQFLRILKSS